MRTLTTTSIVHDEVADAAPLPEAPTPSSRQRRRGRPLVVMTLLLVAAELAVRAASLPTPLEWSSEEAQVKVEELEALGAAGGVHTVFVGSSVVDVAIRPDRFADRAEVEGGAYNAALLGTEMRSMELWLREVVVPTVRPERVVIGLSCREVNGAEVAQDGIYQDFLASPGLQERLGAEPSLRRLERTAGNVSELVRYRSVLRIPRNLLGRDRRVGVNLDLAEGGFNQAYTSRTYPAPEDVHDVLFRGDPSGYRVGDAQTAALDRTLADLRAAGVEAVVVHMATTRDWLDYLPPGGYAACNAAMADHAAAGGAQFVSLGHLDRTLFADPMHVNGAGADRVTDMIADALGSGTSP